MNIESDSDQNKIIPSFGDCRGTCKTPIGCTCVDEEEKEARLAAKKQSATDLQTIEALIAGVASKKVDEKEVTILPSECKAKEAPVVKKVAQGGCCSKKSGGSCCSSVSKLEVYDWMAKMPAMMGDTQMVEVQFKNTRKSYYLNSNNIELHKGDIVAVEALPGHDIGEVTMTGKLVQLQIKRMNFKGEIKRIYRIAKPNDIEKYEEAQKKEHATMLRAREIAEGLELNMKVSDVEYQGDGNKAVFYYIADERVDFRQLIKVYATEFQVKIEMKQIGARQEAGRVGGIGTCGRKLCCSSSMSNFVSVSTSAARLQEIPLNPQKLAGQCGKLKCCLNFEVDSYVEAQRELPARDVVLETKDASYYNFKTDVLSGMMVYSTDRHFPANLVTLHKDRIFDVMKMNKRGEKPLRLQTDDQEQTEKHVSHDLLDQTSITRFDNNNRNKKKKQRNDREQGSVRKENERPKLNRPVGVNAENAAPQAENKPKVIVSTNRINADAVANAANNDKNRNREQNNRQKRNNRNNKNRPPRNANSDAPKNDT